MELIDTANLVENPLENSTFSPNKNLLETIPASQSLPSYSPENLALNALNPPLQGSEADQVKASEPADYQSSHII